MLHRVVRRSLRTTTAKFPTAFQHHLHPKQNRYLRTLPAFSLEGKTCVVTGGAGGLGKQFLTAFALSGAKVACVDLTQKASDDSVVQIQDRVQEMQPDLSAPEIRGYECDATVENDVKSTFDQIVSDFGKVDVQVTAAGIAHIVAAEDHDFPRWRRTMDINLDGSFLFAREAGRHMLANKIKGSIILIASMSASICVRPQKQAAYNASKGGVKMLAKSLATEWAPHGIRVNSLSPGYMATAMARGVLELDRDMASTWLNGIPMGRLGEPHELQGAIVWMASDASSYLTGSDIVVDGGYTAF